MFTHIYLKQFTNHHSFEKIDYVSKLSYTLQYYYHLYYNNIVIILLINFKYNASYMEIIVYGFHVQWYATRNREHFESMTNHGRTFTSSQYLLCFFFSIFHVKEFSKMLLIKDVWTNTLSSLHIWSSNLTRSRAIQLHKLLITPK